MIVSPIRLPPLPPEVKLNWYASSLAMLISTQTDAVLNRWVRQIFILSSLLDATGAESGTFITAAATIHCRNACSSRAKLSSSPSRSLSFVCRLDAVMPLPLIATEFCHPLLLFSKLLHGSWMDVGDFVNLDAGFIILDVEFVGFL